MSERKGYGIRIQRLHLRVAGDRVGHGYAVANAVADLLGEKLSPDANGEIGALRVRVPLSPGATASEVAIATADSIVRALRRGGPIRR